jgi:hypothetical protein
MGAAGEQPQSVLPTRRRWPFYSVWLGALAVDVAVEAWVIPAEWSFVFGVPWGLSMALLLDHLIGDGEFFRSTGVERFMAVLFLAFGAGSVERSIEGSVGWAGETAAAAVAFGVLIVLFELLARRLRPRYKGRGLFV